MDLKISPSPFGVELREGVIIKMQWYGYGYGYGFKLNIWLNHNSWACLQRLGLKFIFQCIAHLEILEISWFRLIILVVENKEVSSVESFGLDSKLFGKSFM